MPRKKQATKTRLENLQKARMAKLSQNKESNDPSCSMQLSACTSSGLDSEPESFCRKFPLSPAVRESGDELERHHGRSSDKETNLQDNCDGPEIIELSKLDHFVSVLQEAQRVAVEAQREKDKQRTRPKTYTRKSRTSSWRYKKHQDDLMKQGYLPVFDFISHVKKKNKHKAPPKLLATEATKRGAIVFEEEEEEEEEEMPPKLLETEATSRAAIVFEEEEEEEENGGNGPEGKSASNPMCDSVVQEISWASHVPPQFGGPREENI